MNRSWQGLRALTAAAAMSLLLPAVTASGATLKGQLRNVTTGGEGTAEIVRVMNVGAGMDAIAVVENVSGSFEFPDLPPQTQPPYLIQIQSAGVLYNERVAVSEGDDNEIEIEVFDVTESFDDVTIGVLHVIFQWDGHGIEVNELYDFRNDSDPPVSVWREPGPILLDVAEDAHGEPVVSVSVSDMPLSQEFVETEEAGVSAVPYPLRPGSTRVVVRYHIDYDGTAMAWAPRIHYPVQKRSVMVWPPDLTVNGPGLEPSDAGLEQYAAYVAPPMEAGDVFDVRISGGTTHGQQASNPIEIRPNRLSESQPIGIGPLSINVAPGHLLIGGVLLALLLGMMSTLTGRNPVAKTQGSVLDALAELEDRFVSGELDQAAFEQQRRQLMQRSGKDATKPEQAGRPRPSARQS